MAGIGTRSRQKARCGPCLGRYWKRTALTRWLVYGAVTRAAQGFQLCKKGREVKKVQGATKKDKKFFCSLDLLNKGT